MMCAPGFDISFLATVVTFLSKDLPVKVNTQTEIVSSHNQVLPALCRLAGANVKPSCAPMTVFDC